MQSGRPQMLLLIRLASQVTVHQNIKRQQGLEVAFSLEGCPNLLWLKPGSFTGCCASKSVLMQSRRLQMLLLIRLALLILAQNYIYHRCCAPKSTFTVDQALNSHRVLCTQNLLYPYTASGLRCCCSESWPTMRCHRFLCTRIYFTKQKVSEVAVQKIDLPSCTSSLQSHRFLCTRI